MINIRTPRLPTLYERRARVRRSADSGTHRERKIRVAGRGVRRDEGSEVGQRKRFWEAWHMVSEMIIAFDDEKQDLFLCIYNVKRIDA